MSSPNNTNPAIPTAAQLAESRLKQWHQQGEALLTLENLRSWINAAGLVLFAPRPQILAPSPSFVEAVLGERNPTPTLEQLTTARNLLARLVAEGFAVPLNLMGAAGPGLQGAVGESPDFVASTAVFSYVFTLRGDKAWKQPPASSGALKVSPLALAAFEALSTNGPLTAFGLAAHLGKEVTEAAVLRALSELWTHLRVLPLPMADGRPALWELASARFTKQIKAGANAGQPAALSALISLYLGQAIVASEDDIENFLSPLAARSRIRDVVHALLAARQLDTLAVEGRTVLHIAGELPAFLAPAAPGAQTAAPAGPMIEVAASGPASADPESIGDAAAPRITKYVPKPRKVGTGYLAKASPSKFAAKPPSKFGGTKPPSRFGSKPGFKSGSAPDRERRPFKKPPVDYAARGFDKPWEEEKARRLAAASKPSEVEAGLDASASTEEASPQTPRVYKPREATRERRGPKPAFGRNREDFPGSRPRSSSSRPQRSGVEGPPRFARNSPTGGDSTDSRAPRKTFSKPGTFGRKREGFTGKREGFPGKPSFGDARPPRREFSPRGEAGSPSARKPYPQRGAGFFSGKPRPSDRDRSAASGKPRDIEERGAPTESGKRVYRKFDAPHARPAKPMSSGRPDHSARPSREFAPRNPGGKPFARPGADAGRSSGRPDGGKGPSRNFRPAKPGPARPGGFTGKSAGTFTKFFGNNKPFGNRPPARKSKPKDEESA